MAFQCVTRVSVIEKLPCTLDLLHSGQGICGNLKARITRNYSRDGLLFRAQNDAVGYSPAPHGTIIARRMACRDFKRYGIASLRHALRLCMSRTKSKHCDNG